MKFDIKKKLKEEIEKQVEIYVSDYFFNQDISLPEMKETLETLEETIENSELSYHALCDFVTEEDVTNSIDDAFIEFVENSAMTEHEIKLEKRIGDLENLSFSQALNDKNSELDHHTLCDFVTEEDVKNSIDKAFREFVENSAMSQHVWKIHKRIEELETLSFSQAQNDENSSQIKRLEEENQEIKERLLHLENFILKIFKGF